MLEINEAEESGKVCADQGFALLVKREAVGSSLSAVKKKSRH